MKIAILTVPYVACEKHFELAVQSLESLQTNYESFRIAVINRLEASYSEDLSDYYNVLIQNDANILARAWNMGIEASFAEDATHVVIPNLDIIARPDTIDNLIETSKRSPDALIWAATSIPAVENHDPEGIATALKNAAFAEDSEDLYADSFSFFMIDRRLFELVGKFCEDFVPAYFEDLDIIDAVRHKGYRIVRSGDSLYYHYGSQTKMSYEPLRAECNSSFAKLENIYLQRKEKRRGII